MRRLSFIESPLELRSVESLGRLDKKKLASVLHAASSIRPGKMSAPAGKKEQPKQEKKYLAQAVAAPKTPTGSGFSPLPSPPTWALSPQSAAKVIDATRPDAVNIDFDDGDGLSQRGETASEETSAAPPAREPPAALPVAAEAPSTASEKRPRADDDDEELKRPKPPQTEAPQPPPLGAPSKPLAVATEARHCARAGRLDGRRRADEVVGARPRDSGVHHI